MSDVTDVVSNEDKAQQLKTVGWVSYALHLIVAVGAIVPGGQMGAVLLIIALVVDFVKREEAQGTWQASHFSWRIRSTLWAGGLYLVTFPLFILLYVPGWIAWTLISIWFLYRIVKGMVAMNASRAVSA
ncbi:MAG: hypothetical protein HC858_11460 [Brachymonas sp.]|nr:hypothetical protein [Brachymonas sp.]